jgi:hypothetical protein
MESRYALKTYTSSTIRTTSLSIAIYMIYQQSTQVPNVVFDKLLATLTFGEFKVLMVIIRQTYGWIDQRTGKRKTRDRISHGQFMQKTELSRRMVSKTVNSLLSKGLICVFD